MELIAAVCSSLREPEAWIIGRGGQQPIILQDDRAWFRRYTLGRTVLYGRKTLETFPGRKPLEGRRNLLLSRTLQPEDVPGAEVFSNLPALLAAAPADACIIGGGAVYRAMLPWCDTAWIREIGFSVLGDDTTLVEIPNLSKDPDWELVSEGRWTVSPSVVPIDCMTTVGPDVPHRLLCYRRTVYHSADRPEGNGAAETKGDPVPLQTVLGWFVPGWLLSGREVPSPVVSMVVPGKRGLSSERRLVQYAR